ncbi:MAG TPA: SusC/RagA family TonB-linked outer membrane protein, partial [Puia sp.]
ASMQLSSTYGERQTANFGGTDDLSAMYGKLSQFFFYVPPYIDGHLVNPGWIGNPIGLIDNSGYVKSSRRGLDGLVSLNYNIPFVKGLSAKVSYSRNDVNNGGKTYQIQHTLYNFKTNGSRQHIYTDTLLSISKAPYPGVPFLGVNNASQGSYQFNAQLSYQREFGKHHIEATVLSEVFEEKDRSDNLTRYSFPVITTDQFFATSADRANSDGNGSESTIGRSSYIGRVNYQYGDKYLFAASLRADGSMIFAPDHRWGYFPSVSAGWKISNEEFFKNALGNTFSLVKLRASLGLTGNDAVAPWQWQERYATAGNAFFGNALQPVIAYGGVVNPNLTWEKSRSTNFGLDVVTAFDLSVSLNYWHRHTYDILGSRIVKMPTTFGGTLPAENYGQVNSQGYELELGYKGHAGAIDYSVNGNFAFATTKVIQRDFALGGLAVDNPNGKPIGYTPGLISTGIIRQQSELDALPAGYTIYGAKPVLGDLNYQDISGIDGKPDGKIDDYDRQIISNYSQGTAPYTAGLNMGFAWKGISINAFFQSAFGYPKLYNDNWGRGFPLDASVNTWWGDMWTPDNPNGSIPKFQGPGEPNSGMASSFWYDKGGYVRLKSLTLGYDLPAKWLSRIKVQRVSVNVTGTNVFFLSQFKWYDPEIGSLASYPNMKTLNIGLNVTL